MEKILRLRYIFLYLIISLLTSCASSTIRVQSISPALNIRKAAITDTKQIKIAVDEFEVSSIGPRDNIIGEAKTGAFNTKTNIVSDKPVGIIFTNAFKKAITESGFVITNQKDADYIIHGTIEKFWVDEYATGLSLEYSKAYVKYDVLIRDLKGNIVWANTLEEFKTSGKSMDTTENNIPTLTLALQESLESIFKDNKFWDVISK